MISKKYYFHIRHTRVPGNGSRLRDHSANRVVVLFCQTNSKTQKKQLKNQREKRIYLEKKNLKYFTRETFVQHIYLLQTIKRQIQIIKIKHTERRKKITSPTESL